MKELDFDYIEFQRRYPGKFIVNEGDNVLVSADSYEELSRKFETMKIDWDRAVIQYVEPADRVVAY